VDFIDTAFAYGDGHSEKILAEVLAERGGRDQVVIATKIPPMDWAWPGKATSRMGDVFPGRWIEECVEKSRQNLKTDALQVEQLHVWNDAWIEDPEWKKTRETMERLREEGKVLHWGISINDHSPETALRVLQDPIMETVQVIYNIYDRSPERELFDLVQRLDLGVIVRVPFDEGALTGAIGADTVFPKGDWREKYFRGDRRVEAARRAAALRGLLGDEAHSLPELALRFCLTRPEVSTVIPGMRRPEHARANAAVSDGHRLSPGLLRLLAQHAWDKNWYGD
jgi:aryl-alcohol dehydrogenase-like predicted oxidoreductase